MNTFINNQCTENVFKPNSTHSIPSFVNPEFKPKLFRFILPSLIGRFFSRNWAFISINSQFWRGQRDCISEEDLQLFHKCILLEDYPLVFGDPCYTQVSL